MFIRCKEQEKFAVFLLSLHTVFLVFIVFVSRGGTFASFFPSLHTYVFVLRCDIDASVHEMANLCPDGICFFGKPLKTCTVRT